MSFNYNPRETVTGMPGRRQAIIDLVAAVTVEDLFSRLRLGLDAYGVRSFSIYTLDGDEASLAFSCGQNSTLETQDVEKVVISRDPFLKKLVSSGVPFLIPASDDASMHSTLDWSVTSGVFKMSFHGHTLGFLALFDLDPAELFPMLDDFAELISVFSTCFHKARVADQVGRGFNRAGSKLRELQEGQDILLLTDRDQIMALVVSRALKVLGSGAGMICLQKDGAWERAYTQGIPSADGLGAMDGLLKRCAEENQAGLVGSLSGEMVMDFDADTIHMASVVAFPLSTAHGVLGCLVGFEATVSQDVIDVVESAALVGATALENWFNQQRMLAQQRVEEQMAVAAKVQQRLLPSGKARIPNLSVAHFSRYCDDTGGDYVDYVKSKIPNDWNFIVGDVSGHGLGAAMLMVDARARIRTLIEMQETSPEAVLFDVNRILCVESAPEEFLTLVLASVDFRTGLLRYAGAGHEPPLVFRSATREWIELPNTGLPLGMDEDATYEFGRMVLEKGDVLVITTDGATEAQDPTGAQLGTAPIKAAVEAAPADANADDLVAAILAETLTRYGKDVFIDDVTYLVVKVEDVNLRREKDPPKLEGQRIYEARYPSSRSVKEEHLSRIIELLMGRFPERDLNGVFMALEEALTNATVHGNLENPERSVRVEVWADGAKSLSIVVEDQGRGFDVLEAIPDYNDQEALAMESGRGLMMMVSLMDEVVYWRNGSSVCMIKRFEGRK